MSPPLLPSASVDLARIGEEMRRALPVTPLVELTALSQATGCRILGKAEYRQRGGSIKDRASLSMILAAEESRQVHRGGTLIDATAGNTGIGLAMHGVARGYTVITVVPSCVSPDKLALLRSHHATVHVVDSTRVDYREEARALSKIVAGAYWVNQFDNTANRLAHYLTTGPEILVQTGGSFDAFVAAAGTGGSLGGTSLYLKENAPHIRTVCADPCGAAVWSWVKTGVAECSAGASIAEGIGQCRITQNLTGMPIDDACIVADEQAVAMLYHLLKVEGISVGLSSALNVCGAVKTARALGRGSTVVTLLCDRGDRYLSTLFNEVWLAEHGFAAGDGGLEFLDQL